MGARRLRACILGIIPGDIVDAAVAKCEDTLIKGDSKPIEDRVRDMLSRFKEIEISQELIEKRLQHKTTAIVRSQLVELGKIYNSIKDGMSKRSDWFDVPASQVDTSDLSEKIKQRMEGKEPSETFKKELEKQGMDKSSMRSSLINYAFQLESKQNFVKGELRRNDLIVTFKYQIQSVFMLIYHQINLSNILITHRDKANIIR